MQMAFTTGCMIEISSRNENNNLFSLSFVVELRKGSDADFTSGPIGCYLSKVNNPFSRLSIAQNGTVSFSRKAPSKGMMLTLELDNEEDQLYYIRSACIKHQETSQIGSIFYGLTPCFETNELRTRANAPPFNVRILSSNPYALTPTTVTPSKFSAPAPAVVAPAAPPSQSSATLNIEAGGVNAVSDDTGLTAAQREFFRVNGYLHLRSLIDAPVQSCNQPGSHPVRSNFIARVVYRIHHALGTPNELTPGGNQSDKSLGKLGGSVSNCKEIRQLVDPSYGNDHYPIDLAVQAASMSMDAASLPVHPAIDYYRSHMKLRGVLADIFGGHDNIPSVNSLGAQIACRFPENFYEVNCEDATQAGATCTTYFSQSRNGVVSYPPLSMTEWHVDGMRQGSRHSFSLLLGVCCSVMSTPFSGNLVLWPGSHKLIHKCYRDDYGGLLTKKLATMVKKEKNGTSSNTPNTNTNTNNSDCADLDEPSANTSNEEPEFHQNEPSDLPNLCGPGEVPLQLVGCRPGDVVLLHPDTAHCGGPNYCQHEDAGGQIRIMVYFRLKSNGFRLLPPQQATYAADGGGKKNQRLNWSEICEYCKEDLYFDLPGFAKK